MDRVWFGCGLDCQVGDAGPRPIGDLRDNSARYWRRRLRWGWRYLVEPWTGNRVRYSQPNDGNYGVDRRVILPSRLFNARTRTVIARPYPSTLSSRLPT